MSRFVNLARLRALCGEKRFAAERSLGGRLWHLVDLDIGHRLMQPERRRPGWTMREAVVYLRRVERDSPVTP